MWNPFAPRPPERTQQGPDGPPLVHESKRAVLRERLAQHAAKLENLLAHAPQDPKAPLWKEKAQSHRREIRALELEERAARIRSGEED